MKKITAVALLLTVGLAMGWTIWRGQFAGAHAEPGAATSISADYLTAAVEKGEIRRVITTTGTLNAIVNVEVGSQLSGQIAELLVDFNTEVRKGQPLARLDQRSFQARVAEAQAAVDLAEINIAISQAKLERTKIDAADSEAQRPVLKARTDNARVKLEAAQNELRRKEALRQRQIGSAVELEDAQAKVASAEAALREAEAIAAAHEHSLAGTKADIQRVDSELKSALASVPQKQALLRVAEIDLDRTTIRSPIDGIVVGRNVNEGQTLATTLEAKTLFTIAGDLRQMEIHAKVDEADIGKIRVGQEATFTVDAYPGRQFVATVRQVRKAPQVQQNVVTYTVVLSAANSDGVLLPGMTALARVTVSRVGPVLTIPLPALRYAPKPGHAPTAEQAEIAEGKPASVWMVGPDGRPQAVVVGVGEDDTARAAVLSGPLKPGDRVIVGEAETAGPRQFFGIRVGL